MTQITCADPSVFTTVRILSTQVTIANLLWIERCGLPQLLQSYKVFQLTSIGKTVRLKSKSSIKQKHQVNQIWFQLFSSILPEHLPSVLHIYRLQTWEASREPKPGLFIVYFTYFTRNNYAMADNLTTGRISKMAKDFLWDYRNPKILTERGISLPIKP